MRWSALLGGVLVQLVVGGVYAWSLFGRALQSPEAMGLTAVQASIPFEVAIGMIFVGASVGGRLQDRSSPRVVAVIGTAIYASGLILASFARTGSDLWLLVLGYGLIGGFGLGMAYIVPVALLQKWFPERRALATGLAVGGFGFGATLTSPVAQWLIGTTPATPAAAFLWIGLGYLAVGLVGSAMMGTPPAQSAQPVEVLGDLTVREALRTPHWFLLTGVLTVAVAAGISLVSVAAVAAEDIGGLDPASVATVVGVLALFNGAGRIAWASLAQRFGQLPMLIAILAIEGAALIALPHARGLAFLVLAAIVYLCYGGAFGTLPSTAGAFFGLRHAGAIYGLMLVGWSLAGVLGPLATSALVGSTANYTLAFSVMGAVALVGVALPVLLRGLGVPQGDKVQEVVEAS